jgi:hypothetical protein
MKGNEMAKKWLLSQVQQAEASSGSQSSSVGQEIFRPLQFVCGPGSRSSHYWGLEITHRHTQRRIPLDEWSARRTGRYIHNTQQTHDTDIHAPGGTGTRNPTKRTTADLRLRSRGHRDLPPTCMESEISLLWPSGMNVIFILVLYTKILHAFLLCTKRSGECKRKWQIRI